MESREEAGAPGEGTALLVDPLGVTLGDVCHEDWMG